MGVCPGDFKSPASTVPPLRRGADPSYQPANPDFIASPEQHESVVAFGPQHSQPLTRERSIAPPVTAVGIAMPTTAEMPARQPPMTKSASRPRHQAFAAPPRGCYTFL